MDQSNYIFGIRAVMEAVEAGREIDKVLVRKDLSGPRASELMALLRAGKIVVQRVPEERINRITRKNHQGVIAYLSAVSYHSLNHIVPELYEEGITPFIVVLDGITDVRNFGAIARTCECAGVNAIVIPERGSVSVGADAVKTSAGALMSLPVCRERNLSGAVKFLKECGYTIVAANEKSKTNYTDGNYCGPVALVMGSEDTGISPEIMRQCDMPVSIPQFGKIQSLNVSVAAGVMIYEVVRQRLKGGMAFSE